MATSQEQISVGTTATQLDGLSGRRTNATIVVHNVGAADVYLGGADVTTSNGLKLPAGGTYAADLNPAGGDSLYGIVASGTNVVHALRHGV